MENSVTVNNVPKKTAPMTPKPGYSSGAPRHLASKWAHTASPVAPKPPETTSGGGGVNQASVIGGDDEAALAVVIDRLWSLDRAKSATIKLGRDERAAIRIDFAKQLAAMKALLKGNGRDGAWLPFLRKRGIPRSTAETIIKRHAAAGDQNNLSDTPQALTEESVVKLLKKLKPKLTQVNTRDLAESFIRRLTAMIDDQVANNIASRVPEKLDVASNSPGRPTATSLEIIPSIDDL